MSTVILIVFVVVICYAVAICAIKIRDSANEKENQAPTAKDPESENQKDFEENHK